MSVWRTISTQELSLKSGCTEEEVGVRKPGVKYEQAFCDILILSVISGNGCVV